MAVLIRDVETGKRYTLRARCFVNAAGPWLDRVRSMDDPSVRPAIRLTKGVHLVISAGRLRINNTLVLTDDAGRIVFVMPHDGWMLIGTTDTDYTGDPAQVRVEASDIDYLIGVVNQALPDARLRSGDIAYSFAGLRVLPWDEGRRVPSAVAREEVLMESSSGLISIGGGKLTTHRAIGERAGARVLRRLGRRAGPSPTRITPLPGARPLTLNNGHDSDAGAVLTGCPWLEGRYGSRAAIVAAIADERPELAMPLAAEAPAIGAEVVFAIQHEWARTVSDFLIRRTAMAWRNPPAAIASAPAVARIMADVLSWDRARTEAELAAFAHLMNNRASGVIPPSDCEEVAFDA